MVNKEINFKVSKIYDNGHQLEVRFKGIQKENAHLDKINNLLNKFIENQYYQETMVRNVASIRTILKDFEEKLLIVSHSDSNSNKEIVEYYNCNLFLYEYNIDNSTSDEDQISIKYKPGNYLDLSFEDFEGNIADYPNSESAVKLFTDMLNKIYQLKHIRAIELDRDSKALIEIYKLFYNENPDFSEKNINIKVQAMISILAEFGISFEDYYCFRPLEKGEMPISLDLEQKIDKLFPFGEIVEVNEPVKLANELKIIIKIVGECIREAISDSYNKDEALITISKVIYAGRYNLSSNCDVKELSDFSSSTPYEVEASIQLVKRIKKRIRQTDIQ